MIRTGIGFDFHRLVPGRRLILGGLPINSEKGLEGHSDADVLLHAICDALLGAAGLDDIGHYFPDTEPRFRGISSSKLVQEVAEKIRSLGYAIVNVDTMLWMEAPRVSPHRAEMKRRIAAALTIEASQVAVKATTMEGCGVIGRGEGIAAQAIVTLSYRGREPGLSKET
ncbi:MAG TPA: 2-C-methyl-D-erythritol 2,4-cyclodiphosphate synthase [Acidobacteriota bacterium]|jgi:2-C-methyl-D-erythritol 2,4-cyclodiphosphate synthase